MEWKGWTQEGVSMWAGERNGPPRWLNRLFLGYGICAVIAGMSALGRLLYGEVYLSAPLDSSALASSLLPWQMGTIIGLSHGFVFSCVGFWLKRMRHTLLHLQSLEELGQRLDIDVDALRRHATQKGIRPRLNCNAIDLYDPDTLLESASLLRGASAPIVSEILVRPATSTAAHTEATALLHEATLGTTRS